MAGMGRIVGQAIKRWRGNPAGTAPDATQPASNAWQSRYDGLLKQTNAAVDQVRAVVKWLAASLSAVAALLLAGVQLTSIGKVPLSHAAIAAGAALATLSAVGVAIFKLVNVLLPAITTRQDVIEAAGRGEFNKFIIKHQFLLAGQSTVEALSAAQEKAAQAARWPDSTVTQKAEARRLTGALDLLVPFGSYFAVREAYAAARRATILAGSIASIGVVVFAWQTGQVDPSDPPSAVQPEPVAGRLQLNDQGVQQLKALLEPGCARQLAQRGGPARSNVNAIAVKSTDVGWSLILIPRGRCDKAEALIVDSNAGRFVTP